MTAQMMKKGLITLANLGLAVAAATQAHAQAQTVFAYNFNGGTTTPVTTAAGVMPSGGKATFTNNFTNSGTDVVFVVGETSTAGDTALRLNVGASAAGTTSSPEEGKAIQFAFSAANVSNFAFQYDTQRSNSGFTTQQVAYSADGGATFTNVTSSMISTTGASASTAGAPATINANGTITPPTAPASGSGYGTVIYNFGSVAALSNNAADIFRITFTGSLGNNSSATANDRIDNLSVNGTPNVAAAPEPSGIAGLALFAGILGMVIARRRTLAA